MAIIFHDAPKGGAEKRYKVPEVAKAIGLSESSVNGYFSNRKITTKNGLTEQQIVEVCKGRRRGFGINWDVVHELRDLLRDRYGIEITEENDVTDSVESDK